MLVDKTTVKFAYLLGREDAGRDVYHNLFAGPDGDPIQEIAYKAGWSEKREEQKTGDK